ncbi:MAG: hypothetical protein RBT78_02510 [Kiritimatiellia bacterium]|jgi:hypothetical protein|nr:hypothetical protein [Kiritimatiellia bacterium]
MSFSSKAARALLGLAVLLTLALLAGCMSDRPTETDMPWSAPATWEGTMPLPGGYMNRYD